MLFFAVLRRVYLQRSLFHTTNLNKFSIEMATVALLALLFFSVQAELCSQDLFQAGLTQCNSADTRSAIFYSETPCEGPVPVPISNLTCQLTCPAGSFLGYDSRTQASACRPCPANTYSSGGGDRFSSSDRPWSHLLTHFTTYCYLSILVNWELNQNCTNWKALEDGSALVSGNTNRFAWVQSELIYYANIVKEEGSLTVEYRKKTRNGLLGPNGLFSIYVNDKTKFEDDKVSNDHWRTIRIPLTKGSNEITLTYEKFSAEEISDLNAYIRFIEIRGTHLNAHYCYPCSQGFFSSQGSDSCNSCKVNEYLIGETCHICPAHTFSAAGSIGVDSCKELPPCKASDYREVYTSCISSIRTRIYEWNSPHICDFTTGVTLPDPEIGLPCEPCAPGYYRHSISADSLESTCVPCPPGTANNSTFSDSTCSLCPAGTFAARIANYTHWSPLPANSTNECHPGIGQLCTDSMGWIADGSGLFSGNNIRNSAYLVLTTVVNVTELEGYFEFSWSMTSIPQSMSRLIVAVDGSMVSGYSNTEYHARSKLFPLPKGIHIVQFTYRSAGNSKEWCSIHWFSVQGSDQGGAPVCKPCPRAAISGLGSAVCALCPAGTQANEEHTVCEMCPDGYYNDELGNVQGCSVCPIYSVPNPYRTTCIGTANITYNNHTYLLSTLTGLQSPDKSLCSKDEFSLFCLDSFYGPLHSHGNEFYLSVLNPGALSIRSYRRVDELLQGYAFALLNKSLIMTPATHSPAEKCATDTSHLIVNLGSRIESINPSAFGLNISYSAGSICTYNPKSTYSSHIQLICDKREGDGYPELTEIEHCNYKFQWRSRQACPLCEKWQTREVRSTCVEGKRQVFLVEGVNCTIIGTGEASSWVEDCNQVGEMMNSKVALVLFILLAVLLVAISIVLTCFCRVNRRYQHLLQALAPKS